jgi:hypothetical protein
MTVRRRRSQASGRENSARSVCSQDIPPHAVACVNVCTHVRMYVYVYIPFFQGGASESKRARVGDSSAYLAKLLEEETKILPFKMVRPCTFARVCACMHACICIYKKTHACMYIRRRRNSVLQDAKAYASACRGHFSKINLFLTLVLPEFMSLLAEDIFIFIYFLTKKNSSAGASRVCASAC